MTKQESNQHVAAEVARTLNNVPGDLITDYVRRTINFILEFCNRDDMNAQLNDIAYEMALSAMKADGVIKTEKDVKSVTRGDTSISYKDPKHNPFEHIQKDYAKRLFKHRRLKVPN